ncbi:MAG: helix-turn-helix domain-containing protein [Bradyrhizobium sp.]
MTLRLIDLGVPRADDDPARLRAWQELTSSLFVTDRVSVAQPGRDLYFRGYHLDRMLFFDHRAGAHCAERTLSQIVAQGVDHVFIALLTSGETRMVRSDGEVAVKAGDFLILDLAQRCQFATAGMSAIQICIPRRHIETRVGSVDVLHMQVLPSGANPLLKLMADHLLNMRACLGRADIEQRNWLASAGLAICNAALARVEGGAAVRPDILAIQIRRFVEENLKRPDLGRELLCDHFNLSRTPLYKMFEADGGVVSYIRSRRLTRGMRILAGIDGGARQRVSSVAYACGYKSEKMFSRAFRRRYGVNPRDVSRTCSSVVVRDKGTLLASWLSSL